MDDCKIIGLVRAFNEHVILEEILEKAHQKCDRMVVCDNQGDLETSLAMENFHRKNRQTVSMVSYRAQGQVHESAERSALYHMARAQADEYKGKNIWFYTFDADEILDCTRSELESVLTGAAQKGHRGVKVKLVNFYRNEAEGELEKQDAHGSIEETRSYCERRIRMRPYFYRHFHDTYWKILPARFHSCMMYMNSPGEYSNPGMWMDSQLWVKHYGYAVSLEQQENKSRTYRKWAHQGDEIHHGDWRSENMKRNIFTDTPDLIPYSKLKSGEIPCYDGGL